MIPEQSEDLVLNRRIQLQGNSISLAKLALRGVPNYPKASLLPPAPLAVAGFMVAGVAAWQYSDRLAGLLGFAVWFLFC